MPQVLRFGHADLLESSDLGQELLALNREQEKFYNDLYDLSNTVRHALLECTTVKKLVDNYPELAKYAPQEVKNHGLAVLPGKIESLIDCTKKTTCDEPKKEAKAKKPDVIKL